MESETTPVRIGDLRKPWDRPKAEAVARSEREEVCERILAVLNEERSQAKVKLRPMTPSHFNKVVKAYCGNGDAGQRLGRLLKLEGDCREAMVRGFCTKTRGCVTGAKAYALRFKYDLEGFDAKKI